MRPEVRLGPAPRVLRAARDSIASQIKKRYCRMRHHTGGERAGGEERSACGRAGTLRRQRIGRYLCTGGSDAWRYKVIFRCTPRPREFAEVRQRVGECARFFRWSDAAVITARGGPTKRCLGPKLPSRRSSGHPCGTPQGVTKSADMDRATGFARIRPNPQYHLNTRTSALQ